MNQKKLIFGILVRGGIVVLIQVVLFIGTHYWQFEPITATIFSILLLIPGTIAVYSFVKNGVKKL